MKKLLRVVICFALVFALTGCYRVKTNMKVNDDKSVDFEMIYAVNSTAMKDFAKQMGGDEAGTTDATESESTDEAVDPENYKWLTDKGYSVAKYESKEKDDSGKEVVYNGVKLSKKFASIDDMAKADESEVDFYKLFGNGEDEEKAKAEFDDSKILNKNGNVYKANLLFDLSAQDNSGMDMSTVASSFDLGYSITLPAKAKSHNATSVSEDGKTLTWKFEYGKKNKVEYEFEFANSSSSTILYVFIGVIAVIVICVVIALVTQKKPTAGANVQPVNNPYNPGM